MVLTAYGWGGWSNAPQASQCITSLQQVVSLVKSDPDIISYYIIDADQLKIWVPNHDYTEFVINRAKNSFNVDISNIIIGFPE